MSRLKFVRKGYYKGRACLFTHRNPATGEVWTDDIKVGDEWGLWVSYDSVKWDTKK